MSLVVWGCSLSLRVSTANLYSQHSTAPLGLNPLSVSAEPVLTYSSGSDGSVGLVTHTQRHFQSHTSKRKFTEEPPAAEQSLQMPPPSHHGACSKQGDFHRSGTQRQKQGKDNLLGISRRIRVIRGQLVQENPLMFQICLTSEKSAAFQSWQQELLLSSGSFLHACGKQSNDIFRTVWLGNTVFWDEGTPSRYRISARETCFKQKRSRVHFHSHSHVAQPLHPLP